MTSAENPLPSGNKAVGRGFTAGPAKGVCGNSQTAAPCCGILATLDKRGPGDTAMTTSSTELQSSRRLEDEAFQGACPLPIAALAIASLFIGDIAVVVAAIAAIG
jgi:hypothetical protein